MPKLNTKIISLMLFGFCSSSSAFELIGPKWQDPSATFYVSIPGASGLWNTTFKDGMSDWNQATVFNFDAIDQFRDPCSQDQFNGTGWKDTLCGDAWGDTLAVTGILFNSVTNIIVETDISFNNTEQWAVYNGPIRFGPGGGVEYDFYRVAVHELGHAMGLGHVPQTSDAIMVPNTNHIDSIRQDDINGIIALYGTDGTPPPPNPGPSTADLKNISTRGYVGPGAQNMHAGFVVEGTGTVLVLVKAGGPTLPPPINGLQDPNLRLFNAANGMLLHQNDNWQDDPSAGQISESGLAPQDFREPAFVIELGPGSYTAVVNGKNDTTGIALPSVTKVKSDN